MDSDAKFMGKSMKNGVPTLSVVTPSYNRGALLKKCFESLHKQTNFNFEWIVVDDGSVDDTKTVMESMTNSNIQFPIRYIWKENGGKHTALNAAHPFIQGKYVLILDSDDMLTPDAVEVILSAWEQYASDQEIGIITFVKKTTDGRICAYAKDENVPTDVLRYQRVCVTSSDCCEVIRSELFKKYPFPVFEGERFLAETALWYRAGLDGSCVYINKPVYICEYLEGGLTKSGKKLRINNPKGGMYTSYLRMHSRCSFKERMKAGLLYICYGYFASKKVRTMIREAKPYRFLAILCLIPGQVLHLLWRKKYFEG